MDLNPVIEFWFKNKPKWFVKDTNFDQSIKEQFHANYTNLSSERIELEGKDGSFILAAIIVLDQFSRNMFRGGSQMFATDSKALELTKYAIKNNLDKTLPTNDHRQFLYMPLMHSEMVEDQKLCVELFSSLQMPYALDYAKQHLEIIERFGRFPHRNEILNRTSTEEELKFLETHNGF